MLNENINISLIEDNILKNIRDDISDLKNTYDSISRKSKEKLELIKNGVPFGIIVDNSEVVLLDLIDIVNDKDCLIKVYNRLSDSYHIISVHRIHIVQ